MQRGLSAILLIVLAVPVVVAIAVGVAVLNRPRQTSLPSVAPSARSLAATEAPSKRPVVTPVKHATASSLYKADYFTIALPSNWTDTASASGQVRVDQLHPSATKDYPSFIITRQPFGQGQTAELRATYEQLNLVKSQITLGNMIATEYSGTLPLTISNGQISKKPIQIRAIVANDQMFLYEIEYKYQGSQSDAHQDELFQQLLTSIVIH